MRNGTRAQPVVVFRATRPFRGGWVCRRGAEERAGRGLGATTRVSLARAGGGGKGIPVARGRAPARSWSRVDGNVPPPSPLLGRPGDRGAVRAGGEILKKTRDAARCRDRRSRARDERRRRPRDARARARGPRRLVRDPRRGGAARTSARRARISPARLLPSRCAARGEGGKPGGSARPVAGARGGFERGTHLSACSASLALYTRSARDRPARSSGAVIGLMAGGGGARARTLREWDVGRWARDGAVLEFANRRASARKSFFRLTRIPTPPLFAPGGASCVS